MARETRRWTLVSNTRSKGRRLALCPAASEDRSPCSCNHLPRKSGRWHRDTMFVDTRVRDSSQSGAVGRSNTSLSRDPCLRANNHLPGAVGRSNTSLSRNPCLRATNHLPGAVSRSNTSLSRNPCLRRATISSLGLAVPFCRSVGPGYNARDNRYTCSRFFPEQGGGPIKHHPFRGIPVFVQTKPSPWGGWADQTSSLSRDPCLRANQTTLSLFSLRITYVGVYRSGDSVAPVAR
jgi:hypothetical protein